MELGEIANSAISTFNTYIWYIGFVFLIGLGLYFTARLYGVQIRDLPTSIKLTGRAYDKNDGQKKTISSFEAFCVGLGARVGVGNIAGVAVAIAMGGPGAIFWMWIFAIIGAGTSFVECVLGQLFKEKKSDGLYHGGPAYYVKNGLKNKKFAIVMAIMVIILYGIGFIGVQASNATNAFTGAFDFENNQYIIAILMTVLAAAIIFGGIKRVASASTKIVPIMAFAWIVLAIVAVCINYVNIPSAISAIINGAFNIEQFLAGGVGAAIMMGLKRGVFSNEAGIGSIPNVASAAKVEHPVKQGLIQSFGVMIDTLIVCSATAFVILTYSGWENYLGSELGGSNIVQEILSEGFLGSFAPAILAIFMIVFAFTSLISYYSMCEANVRFFSNKESSVLILRMIIVVVVFISSIISLQLMWDLCDAFMAVMGILNMTACFLLFKYVKETYNDYKKQKSEGIKEPIFNPDVLSGDKSGITVWTEEELKTIKE